MNSTNGDVNGDMMAECQRLREIIAHLQSEREKDNQVIGELTAERDRYYRAVLDCYRERFLRENSKEDLEHWAAEVAKEPPQSLDEVLSELGISKTDDS